jgi:hypothetical protein
MIAAHRYHMILLRAQGLYEDVCGELQRTDPNDNARCLTFSKLAASIAVFIVELEVKLRVRLHTRVPF